MGRGHASVVRRGMCGIRCALLVAAGAALVTWDSASVWAADGQAAPLTVRIAGATAPLPPESDEDIDLGGGLIELLITGQIRERSRNPTPLAVARPVQPQVEGNRVTLSGRPEVVSYAGDLPTGTVVVNETRGEIYKVVGPGRAQLYRPDGDVLSLAKILVMR